MSASPFSFWIPPEIVHEIATWCSKDSLTALARTCVTFSAGAEKQLYEDVGVVTVECLDTLLANPRKRDLVRQLTFIYRNDNNALGRKASTVLACLCDTLVDLKSLRILRLFDRSVHRPRDYHDKMGVRSLVKRLGEVLYKAKFHRLHTVHCDKWFLAWNVCRFIKSQPGLKVFSTNELLKMELSELHEMEKMQAGSVPAVFAEESYRENRARISIFPGLYAPTRVQATLKALESHWRHWEEKIETFTIYVAGPTQVDVDTSIRDSCAIIRNRMNVKLLYILFDRPYDIPVKEVADAIRTLPELSSLSFLKYTLDDKPEQI
ncbi:hypothetical protein CPC08DRAFT_705464 [Agrocybe pediades]|nr:hypothetical protein CPC08DRAFT_705464 [Agrocybe pediades]